MGCAPKPMFHKQPHSLYDNSKTLYYGYGSSNKTLKEPLEFIISYKRHEIFAKK